MGPPADLGSALHFFLCRTPLTIGVLELSSPAIDLHGLLRQYWGYDEFRPQQEAVIRCLLGGRDAAVVMPTGGGKSLCYQLPALAGAGTTVVISPLIALMQDQAEQLAQMGIPAAVLNSTMPYAEQQKVMWDAKRGVYRLLYLSPERMAREETVNWLHNIPLAMFAIDEAHCISEWGHEFRPEYRMLGRLRSNFPGVPIAAFTASATQKVRHDIIQQLGLYEPGKFIRSFHRRNLRYIIRQADSATQFDLLIRTLKAHEGNTVIVYAPTVAGVESTVDDLGQQGIDAIPYHGQMGAAIRSRNQNRWMADEVRVLVGTLAFGLGINKPHVRAVIHLALPKSLEQYYQEAGRAGRDGEPADCLLLWQKKDIGLLAYFIEQLKDKEERERAWDRYRVLRNFVESSNCRHRTICEYFGETPKWEDCGGCDVCGHKLECLTDQAAIREKAVKTKAADAVDEPLRDYLRQWRLRMAKKTKQPAFIIMHDATIDDLARRVPQNNEELLKVFGIGQAKAEKWGQEILDAIAAYLQGDRIVEFEKAGPKDSPAEMTLQLLKEGKSFEEIASIRDRRVQTVVTTVASLVEQGKIEWSDKWMNAERRKLIEDAARQQGFERLKPIKDLLPEDVSYDEIRLVLAGLSKNPTAQG